MKNSIAARFCNSVTFLLIYFSCGGVAMGGHGACSDCHIRGKSLKNPNVNELCISCHPDNVKDHVLDVVSQTVPTGLPLAKGNKITCVTCHDAHDKAENPNMLRMEQTKICTPCHPNR